MFTKLYKKALGEKLDIKERIFRIILLITSAAAVLAVIEALIVMSAKQIIIPLVALLLAMGIAMVLTFKYENIKYASMIVGVVIIAIVFPLTFFFSGGINGGSMVWFILGFMYIFLMFEGKQFVIFLVILIATNVITYILAYQNPEWVWPLSSKSAVYFDSIFSVILIGITGGAILKFQMKVFEEERSVTLSQKNEIQKISESKNSFFANMSHEIRTPINTIIGLNEMILRDNCSEEIRDNATHVHIASKMLLSLVNDILDLSKIEMKKMEIVSLEYDTKELFMELIDMIHVRMEEKKLDFFIDIDEKLPSVLLGDAKRLKQILLNILTNAIKYTPEGSVTLRVRSEEIDEEHIQLIVAVSDTGIGIKKEDIKSLYEAFRRFDTEKNIKVEGTGLGLSITKQLLDLMGGEIQVDSIYTKGSIFTITLKQQVVHKKPIGSIDFTAKIVDEQMFYYKQSFEAPEARILVVDDNEMNLLVVSKLLSATKVQIDTANSGAECLKCTKQKYYDVILMDYMMPLMNGAETLKQVRDQENGLCREVPVIVLTADIATAEKQMYHDYGFDGYLEKPVHGSALEYEVLRFLPKDIVEYRMIPMDEQESAVSVEKVSNRKRKKVYITADCVCDLTDEMIQKYDIGLMYLYIRTKMGRFRDREEIDSDGLVKYLSEPEGKAYSDSPSVEEYAEFFADALTQAEDVIHISYARRMGKSYDRAVIAAEGFDHVHIVNSENVSAGMALVTLYAGQLAQQGYEVSEILKRLEKMKTCVKNKLLLPNVDLFYERGHTNSITARLCKSLNVRPVIKLANSKLYVSGVRFGTLERIWKPFVRCHLFPKWIVNGEIVYITHAGCTIKEEEMLKEEVRKIFPFKKIIIQKASVSNACNAGIHSVSIAFCKKIRITEDGKEI